MRLIFSKKLLFVDEISNINGKEKAKKDSPIIFGLASFNVIWKKEILNRTNSG